MAILRQLRIFSVKTFVSEDRLVLNFEASQPSETTSFPCAIPSLNTIAKSWTALPRVTKRSPGCASQVFMQRHFKNINPQENQFTGSELPYSFWMVIGSPTYGCWAILPACVQTSKLTRRLLERNYQAASPGFFTRPQWAGD